jgi:hypothetical protein
VGSVQPTAGGAVSARFPYADFRVHAPGIAMRITATFPRRLKADVPGRHELDARLAFTHSKPEAGGGFPLNAYKISKSVFLTRGIVDRTLPWRS